MTVFRVVRARKKTRRFLSARGILTAVVISAACLVFVLSTPAGAGALFDYLQIYPAIKSSRLRDLVPGPPAAIVILSAGRRTYAPEFPTGGTGTVDGLSLERIRYGAFVARQTNIPVLLSGGGDGVPMATLMAGALSQDYGITPRWTETKSTTTAQNAMFSAILLKASGVRRVILVTHAWHMKRAAAAFKANGLAVIPAPTAFYSPMPGDFISAITPGLGTFRMSGYGIHELVGGIWYRLRYGY